MLTGLLIISLMELLKCGICCFFLQRAGYKREKFLKYNNKVLRFYTVWDDRKSMFGDKRYYTLNYYLADDAVEVRGKLKRTEKHSRTHMCMSMHSVTEE